MKPIVFLCGLLLAIGCQRESSSPPGSAATKQTYAVRGVVREIPPDRHHASIQHEKIPGYMAAMTMDFSIKDTNELKDISVGDEINFTLVVTADDDWIQNLQRTGKTSLPTTARAAHAAESELQVGDSLPDFEFVSEAGRPVKFSDFRGRAVAFTFFFTSCPLPEFCPRMSRNFSEARKILLADASGPTNWEFLSISFDSGFDAPPILASYARIYRGPDAERWLFAVAATNTLASLAPKVDLNVWRENGTLSHNLRTVVLDGGGKIFRQFDGNDWMPEQLADAMRAAARGNLP